MKHYKVYTAGKMSGLSYDEQNLWRNEVWTRFHERRLGDAVTVVNPAYHYNPNAANTPETEREAMNWDLAQILDSDVVLVNLDGIDSSTGTVYELGFINALNRCSGKYIHVIGIGDCRKLHPWIQMSLFHVEPTIYMAVSYIAENIIL